MNEMWVILCRPTKFPRCTHSFHINSIFILSSPSQVSCGGIRRSSASPRPPCDGTFEPPSDHRPGRHQARNAHIFQIGLHLTQTTNFSIRILILHEILHQNYNISALVYPINCHIQFCILRAVCLKFWFCKHAHAYPLFANKWQRLFSQDYSFSHRKNFNSSLYS